MIILIPGIVPAPASRLSRALCSLASSRPRFPARAPPFLQWRERRNGSLRFFILIQSLLQLLHLNRHSLEIIVPQYMILVPDQLPGQLHPSNPLLRGSVLRGSTLTTLLNEIMQGIDHLLPLALPKTAIPLLSPAS